MNELQIYENRLGQGGQAQNCVQGLGAYSNLQPQFVYCNCPQAMNALEIRIEQIGKEFKLDYGAKLRLLIADPIKGIDLREALSKLKTALAQACE